jgi:hypothetical protein
VEGGVVRLEDGTATAALALEGKAVDIVTLIRPGDTLNATGTPDDRDEIVLVVSDPVDVVLLGDPGGSGAGAAATSGQGAAPAPVPPTASDRWPSAELGAVVGADAAAALAGSVGTRPPGAAMLAFATLLLTALLAACLAAYRIARSRRAARARIQARLDALAAPTDART